MVLLNAAAALVIAGRAVDFAGGVRCAADAIDSGAGLRLLAQLAQIVRLTGRKGVCTMPIQLQTHRRCSCSLAAVAIPSHAQQIVVSKDNRTIAVTTSADANADADTVTVQIGFVAYGADQDSAYALGSKTSNAIAAALKAAGIPQDAIQSESQSIAPVQQYGNQEWTPAEKAERKFQVQQSWSVKTAAANGAKVLDVAVKAGANQSGQMTWSVADQDGLQAKAAKLALDRARQIAQQMAAGLNATLGPLVYASNEAPARGPQPLMRAKAMMAAAPAAQRGRAAQRQRAKGYCFRHGLCSVQHSIGWRRMLDGRTLTHGEIRVS